MVVVDTEQLADDSERQRVGEAGAQVNDSVGPLGGEAIEELVSETLDRRSRSRHPRRPECRRHQPAETPMVGCVHGQHVVGELGAGQSLGHQVGILVQRGDHVLGQALVAERLSGGVVAEHHPGAVAIGQPDVLHWAAAPRLGEGRERVVTDGVVPRAPHDLGHKFSGR